MEKSIFLHIYNRLFYGAKVNDYSDFDLRENPADCKPVVFLSTGRCGTLWISERLEKNKGFVPIHHPNPVMRVQAAEMYDYDFKNIETETAKLLDEIFLAGREEIFVAAKRAGKELAITDSRGTFFAYVIARIFPDAKFVFIHRHPYEVIRSGLKRGWYTAQNDSELNRISPGSDDPHFDRWADFAPTQKIAWLWQETNAWIMNFLDTIPADRKHQIGFNDWNPEELDKMFNFMGAGVSRKEIEKNLNKKTNAQKSSVNPTFKEWTESDRKMASDICRPIAEKLNYTL